MENNYRRIFATSLAVIFVTACFYYTLDIGTSPPQISDKNSDTREVIYFGVISRYSPQKIIRGYQPLMDHLSKVTPYKFELRLSRNYMETVEQLTEGKVSFASLGNFTYVNANRDYGVTCIAMPLNRQGESVNFDAFIVQDNSPIQSVSDLSGKSVAMASRYSFSSWMAIWALKQEGLSVKELSAYTHLDHHDQVAEKVLVGEYNAGMVKALVADKYQDEGLRTIYVSPPFPSVPLVAGSAVSEQKIRVVQEALVALRAQIEKGIIQTDEWDDEIRHGYVKGDDASYDYTRRILYELGEWE